jgi:hypothetical protein
VDWIHSSDFWNQWRTVVNTKETAGSIKGGAPQEGLYSMELLSYCTGLVHINRKGRQPRAYMCCVEMVNNGLHENVPIAFHFCNIS